MENHDTVKVEEGLRATERVVCSGRERTLEECDIEGMGEGGSCKLEEDIVSISCIPDSWATCEVSWKTGMDAPPRPAPRKNGQNRGVVAGDTRESFQFRKPIMEQYKNTEQ